MTADDAGTGPEAGPGPNPAVPAPTRRPTRRQRWRNWRRTRPFWGGLLLILAGLELFAIPLSGVLIHGAVKLVIYIGIGGVFGVLIGALLVVAGLVSWFNQAHKTFYGIAGVLLGVVSFPASNLGGLFIGMLMAIIGGSIVFAWTPIQPSPEEVTPIPASPDDVTAVQPLPDDAAAFLPGLDDATAVQPASDDATAVQPIPNDRPPTESSPADSMAVRPSQDAVTETAASFGAGGTALT